MAPLCGNYRNIVIATGKCTKSSQERVATSLFAKSEHMNNDSDVPPVLKRTRTSVCVACEVMTRLTESGGAIGCVLAFV